MLSEETVRQALAGVADPLLGQSVVDLGMVHSVLVTREGRVVIRLILPSRRWPARAVTISAVQTAVAEVFGAAEVDVQVLDESSWSPYRLAQALKAPLGLPAVEPPVPVLAAPATPNLLRRLLQRLRSV